MAIKKPKRIFTKLLDKIPAEYLVVHVAMSLAGANRQNLETVKRLLLSEETRLGQINDISSKALYIKKNKQVKNSKIINNDQSKDKKIKRCFGCGKAGHFKRDCPKHKDHKKDIKDNKKQNKAGNVCFSCIEVAMVGDKDDKVLTDSGASTCSMIKLGLSNMKRKRKL